MRESHMSSSSAPELLSMGLRIPLAFFFLWFSYRNLSGDAETAADFQRWKYSEKLRVIVGVAQALGAAALLLPQTCFAGSLLLSGVLVGAIYTHVRFDPIFMTMMPASFLIP